jgi:hypothetical protein
MRKRSDIGRPWLAVRADFQSGGNAMRVMMTVQIPTKAGNAAIKDGSLPQIVGKALDALKAEAAYFTSEEGMRTGLIFFDMADSSDIPSAAEPFFMGLDAKITFAPVMNVDEMRAGVGKAMQAA